MSTCKIVRRPLARVGNLAKRAVGSLSSFVKHARASLLVLPAHNQFHRNVRRTRPVARILCQLEANDGLALTCVGGNPNWAVIEHASASFLELALGPLLLSCGVRVNERGEHRHACR